MRMRIRMGMRMRIGIGSRAGATGVIDGDAMGGRFCPGARG